jgi:hypothetical protein
MNTVVTGHATITSRHIPKTWPKYTNNNVNRTFFTSPKIIDWEIISYQNSPRLQALKLSNSLLYVRSCIVQFRHYSYFLQMTKHETKNPHEMFVSTSVYNSKLHVFI